MFKRKSSLLLLPLLFLAAFFLQANPYGKAKLEFSSLVTEEDVPLEEVISYQEDQWRALENNMYSASLFKSGQLASNERSVLWIRIQLPRRTRDEKVWIEFSPNVGLDGRLAEYQNGRWQWFQPEGLSSAEETRHPVNFLTFAVSTDNPKKTAYLKLDTSLVFHFRINTIDQNELIGQSVKSNLFNGFLLGFLFLAIIYNLTIGISAGERMYVYYAFYVFCNAIYISIISGYLRLIFPEWGGLGNMGNLGASLVLFSGIVFVREFLNTSRYAPKTDYILRLMQSLLFASLLFISFLDDFIALLLVLILGTIAPITVLTAATLCYRANHPYAGYFLFAWSLFIASIFIWVGMWIGIFEPTVFVTQVFKVGAMIEITFLSLVLSYRYTYLKDQTEQLNKAKTAFKELSETDELTGVLNRRGFLRQAEEIVQNREQLRVWLTIDIDHFKQFNDQYGHMAGDHLLAEFGNILDTSRRREDLAAKLVAEPNQTQYRRAITGRIGGEEFAVVVTDCSLGQAKLYAERLIEEFRNLLVEDMRGQRVGSTLSIGATEIRPEDTLESVWKRADKLLYEAKNSGRDQVVTG
ncbi:MAG: hypothetical protein C9356_16005 [Oleiphilus sp.]|nr:MAG: hypothetical protein C9356_16005 [Oleiphilus sp.]